jgi:hypothetical protein
MLTVYYKNVTGCVIRPTPLISISYTPLRNKVGVFGGSYEITLNGTIINNEGSPFSSGILPTGNATDFAAPFFGSLSKRPDGQLVGIGQAMQSIIHKQNSLRELFALDGQLIELSPISNDDSVPAPPNQSQAAAGQNRVEQDDRPILKFYPQVQSVNFEEGIYVNTCKYTVTLRADVLLDKDDKVFTDGSLNSTYSSTSGYFGTEQSGIYGFGNSRLTENELKAQFGGFVEDFSESWSLEAEDGNGNTTSRGNVTKAWRLTRNTSATGKTHYSVGGARVDAWVEARNYLHKNVLYGTIYQGYASGNWQKYPNYQGNTHVFASGLLNLSNKYKGYNHSITENIDRIAGSYSISETWLLSQEDAYENYKMSISSSLGGPFVNVSIDGTIKGLSLLVPSGTVYGGESNLTADPFPLTLNDGRQPATPPNTAYQNALNKYHLVSNSGRFGLISDIYKRANASVGANLNSQPKSVSLGLNEFTGEITYNVEFDNRPLNLISGVLTENISVNDTYPGDVFAMIPVIGRATGPVLQYIGGRTEYKRDVGIELVVDYTDIPYGLDRTRYLLSKPSLNEPIRSQINNVIASLSPANEPGIRKYFLNPPSESWNPKEGRYSLNLSWVYELDH